MINRPDRVVVWSAQLKANDFPPVCAMTGRPAETWRKFRFVTLPGWAYAFLALFCLGLLPIFIIWSAVSRRATGYLPLTRASQTSLRLATWIPLSLIPAALVIWLGAGAAASVGQSTTTTSSQLVYTTWVSDPNAGGAEPGYRPQLTDLTGKNVRSVDASPNSSGSDWVVNIEFDAQGTALFSQLTTANVAACPGDPNTDPKASCAQRHLGMWIGLTQYDIDNWDVGAYSFDMSDPWKPGVRGPLAGKLVSDPITIEPINGGHVQLSGNYSKEDAYALVNAIKPATVNKSNGVASSVGLGLFLLGFLALFGGVIGVLVIRRVYGPTGKVMALQPGYSDNLVEIRHVHPNFVEAVRQHQQARATQPPRPAWPPQSP